MKRLLFVVWSIFILLVIVVFPYFVAHIFSERLKSAGVVYSSLTVDYRGRFVLRSVKIGSFLKADKVTGSIRLNGVKDLQLFSPVIDVDTAGRFMSGGYGISEIVIHNGELRGKWGVFKQLDGKMYFYGRGVVRLSIAMSKFLIRGKWWKCRGDLSYSRNGIKVEALYFKRGRYEFLLKGDFPKNLYLKHLCFGSKFGILKGNYRMKIQKSGIELAGKGVFSFSFDGKEQSLAIKKVFIYSKTSSGVEKVVFDGVLGSIPVHGVFSTDGKKGFLFVRLAKYLFRNGNADYVLTDVRLTAESLDRGWNYVVKGRLFGGDFTTRGEGGVWKFSLERPKELPSTVSLPAAVQKYLVHVDGMYINAGRKILFKRVLFENIKFEGLHIERLVLKDYPQSPVFLAEKVRFKEQVYFPKLSGKIRLSSDGVIDIETDNGISLTIDKQEIRGTFRHLPVLYSGNVKGVDRVDGNFRIFRGKKEIFLKLYTSNLSFGSLRISKLRLSVFGNKILSLQAILPSGMEFNGRGSLLNGRLYLNGKTSDLHVGNISFGGLLNIVWKKGNYTFSADLRSIKNGHRLVLKGLGRGKDIVLNEVRFDGLKGNGIIKYKESGYVRLHGNIRPLLKPVLHRFGIFLDGTNKITVRISDIFSSPKVAGYISFKGASVYSFKKHKRLISNFSADVWLDGDNLIVRDATGNSNGVNFHFSGVVTKKYDYITVTGSAKLSGLKFHPSNGKISIPFENRIYLKKLKLFFGKNCWLEDKDYRFLVTGSMVVNGFLSSLRFSGGLKIMGGNLLFLGSAFRVIRGTVSFDFSRGYKPVIDLDAISRMYGNRVRVSVGSNGSTSISLASGGPVDLNTDELLYSFLPFNSFLLSIGKKLGLDWLTVGLGKNGSFRLSAGKDIAYNLFLFYNYEEGMSSLNLEYLFNSNLSFSTGVDDTGNGRFNVDFSIPLD